LRIQTQKKALGVQEISAGIFLRHLIRRVSMLLQFQCIDAAANWVPSIEQVQMLNVLAEGVQDEKRLSWQDWTRYSSRQQQEMVLGGVTGHWLLRNVPPELQTYIYLGQWLHAGKETAFGLGLFEQTDTEWQTNLTRGTA
jgi:hypothetical protein